MYKIAQEIWMHNLLQARSDGLRNPPRVLIFANKIKTVRFVHQTVSEAGFRTVMLHGDRSQEEREVIIKPSPFLEVFIRSRTLAYFWG